MPPSNLSGTGVHGIQSLGKTGIFAKSFSIFEWSDLKKLSIIRFHFRGWRSKGFTWNKDQILGAFLYEMASFPVMLSLSSTTTTELSLGLTRRILPLP